jgi:cobalt-zinc-cadmium efflux system protein
MLVDVLTIGIALIAAWFAERSFKDETTLNSEQVGAWAALINGLIVMGIAVLIAWKVVERFYSPEPINGLPMLVMAALGVVVKGVNASLLYEDSHHAYGFCLSNYVHHCTSLTHSRPA